MQQHLAKVYYDLNERDVDIRFCDDRRTVLTLRQARFSSLSVSHLKADPGVVSRSRSAVLRENSEDFFFRFVAHGDLRFRQGPRNGFVHAGGMVFLNTTDAYSTGCDDLLKLVSLRLPSGLLRAELPWIDSACAVPTAADPDLVPLVRNFFSQMLSVKNAAVASQLEDLCIHLLAVMLDAGRKRHRVGFESESLANAMLVSLQEFIRKHLGDPELTVHTAAQHCRVSVRHVQKLYHSQGTTFVRTLLDARLRMAHRLITREGTQDQQIAQIAYRCGFLSPSHFAARFREHFGASPRELRVAAQRQSS